MDEAEAAADTVPFDVIKEDSGLPQVVNREDTVKAPELPAEAQGKVLEPALIRGGILAVAGLVSSIVGHQLDLDWVEPFISLYVFVAPIGLAWWIRRHVTPNKK